MQPNPSFSLSKALANAPGRVRRVALFTFLFTLLSLSASSVQAQPGSLFGKNKVQYKDFGWKYIQSPHFDVYFYQGGKELAEFCAEQSEVALASIQKTLKYDITNRIAILVYNSHNDFQQTNAVSEFLPEGVGGVTELFKNRVILPFEGNYEMFRHVIHHELVHAVINDMFTGGSYQSLLTGSGMQIPSWMNEGLAEYESLKGLDIETDMFMRDATLNDAVPPLERLGGYVQYRVGQTMYWYIAQKYGPEKVGDLLQRIKTSRSIEQGFRTTFGLSVAEFGDKFLEALKVLYYPDIAKYEDPKNFAEVLADHVKLENFINSSPTVSPQGDMVAFISDRNEYYDVWVQSLIRPRDIKRVLSGGGASANFEELHLLTPGLTWSPDGKKLALAAKAGEQDVVYIIDVNTLDQEKLPLFDLDGIQQVKWAPDASKIALVGIKSGASDIYTYDFSTKKLENLTNDFFSDYDPEWSADSKSIYFASERDNYLVPGQFPTTHELALSFKATSRDLYRLDIGSNQIARILNTPDANEMSPTIAQDNGTLYYISNQNGVNNIWTSSLTGENARPLTNSLSKIDQISVSRDGTKLVFSAMHKGAYDMFLLRNPSDRRMDSLTMTEFRKTQLGLTASRIDTLGSDRRSPEDTTKGYGNVGVDLKDYVFSAPGTPDRNRRDMRPGRPVATVTGYKDSSGNYVEHDYKTVFSPDIIIGSAGYTGYYGLQGTTQMLFSDQLGNQQLFFATNLILDLKNSDYLLAYYNLENRLNWGLTGFHTAQFINVLFDATNSNSAYVTARFNSTGLTGTASYPFSRFNRLDINGSLMMLERDLIVDLPEDQNPTKRKFAFAPSIAYVHDDAIWSYFYPKDGTRYNIGVSAAPKIGNDWLGFISPAVDFRHYFKISTNMSLATRIAGSASFGPNPQRFFVGGVDSWINRFFNDQPLPLNEPEDFAFFTAGRPLRGYAYNEKIGTKYAMMNLELRYPFPIIVGGFPLAFFGDMFVDAGTAWNNKVYLFQKTPDNKLITRDLLMSAGTGIRTYLFGFYVHMDIAWRTNLDKWSNPEYIFSIGEDF